MKKYIFTIYNGKKPIGTIEKESETEMTNKDGVNAFLDALTQHSVTKMYIWEGNILDKTDLKEITAELTTTILLINPAEE